MLYCIIACIEDSVAKAAEFLFYRNYLDAYRAKRSWTSLFQRIEKNSASYCIKISCFCIIYLYIWNIYHIIFYIIINTIMPNRDGTWPQGKGPMTGTKKWSCSWPYGKGENVPFASGRWKVCGRGLRRWIGNRWNSVVDTTETPKED